MREEENDREVDIAAELRKRDVLPGREAKFTKDGQEILLFRCSDCGFTVEDTAVAEDFTCPLCDAKNYFFLEVDFKLFPNLYINQPYDEKGGKTG